MNVRCPGCNATVEYSINDQKMICKYCGITFAPEEASGKIKYVSHKNRYMDAKCFTCQACGAELIARDTEATAFCYYCGQPSVLEEQISDYLEPDYVIPFQVTREEALKKVRETLRKGFFISGQFKNFKEESLTPVYVPYWITDVFYEDYQIWKVIAINNKLGNKFIRIGGRIRLDKYAVDGSEKLENYAAQRLGPYDLEALKPFDPSYLSGFYADRYDVGQEEIEVIAGRQVKVMFDDEIRKTVAAEADAKLISQSPQYDVGDVAYALFPTWFLNFNVKGRVYTVLVNGQNGKVVMTLPVSRPKLALGALGLTLGLTAGICGLMAVIYAIAFATQGVELSISGFLLKLIFPLLAVILIMISASCFRNGLRDAANFKLDLKRTNGERNLQYIFDRGTEAFRS